MRTPDSKLREKYRAAVARLQAKKASITLASISDEAGIGLHTVRNFMYRNPRFASSLSLAIREQRTHLEYIAAAQSLAARKMLVNRHTLARELGRDFSNVCRVLRRNQDLRAAISVITGVLIGWGKLSPDILKQARETVATLPRLQHESR